jgi:transcription-repair coupling factor (superfamily II helicase)
VDALAAELTDRFGPVPAVVADLLEQARIRVLAHRLRMQSLKHVGGGKYALVFGVDNALSEVGLRLLLDEYGPRIRFRSEHAFDIDLKATPTEGGLAALTALLGKL